MRVFGDAVCPSGVFDWLVAPGRAVRVYLRNQFSGTFELDDLIVGEDGYVHAKSGTQHMHAFPRNITQDELLDRYAEARSRHEYLAEKTLNLFRGDRKLLLCLGARASFHRYARLWLTIRWHFPTLKFILLNGPRGGAPEHAEQEWKGDDSVWDRHLKSFKPGQSGGA